MGNHPKNLSCYLFTTLSLKPASLTELDRIVLYTVTDLFETTSPFNAVLRYMIKHVK